MSILYFLEQHKGWAMALGFNNLYGAHHESEVTEFLYFNEDGFEL
jgi:hypothetical protein